VVAGVVATVAVEVLAGGVVAVAAGVVVVAGPAGGVAAVVWVWDSVSATGAPAFFSSESRDSP
jgi:hypothetical protein